jgi:hypothetical protein
MRNKRLKMINIRWEEGDPYPQHPELPPFPEEHGLLQPDWEMGGRNRMVWHIGNLYEAEYISQDLDAPLGYVALCGASEQKPVWVANAHDVSVCGECIKICLDASVQRD